MKLEQLEEAAFFFNNGDGPYCAPCAWSIIEIEGIEPDNYESIHYSLLGNGSGFQCGACLEDIPE